MQVNSNSLVQQTQMRKMDGTGGGKGQGGMRDIMQSLSQDDRNSLKNKMSSLNSTQRADMVSQMKSVDKSTMSAEEYTQSLMDILNDDKKTNNSSSNTMFSVYA